VAMTGMLTHTFICLLTVLQQLSPSECHSYLAKPPGRNTLASANGDETCPHCLQAGGPATVKSRAEAVGGSWPTHTVPESHGLCGDPVQGRPVATDWRTEEYLTPTPVQATYTAGEIVEFIIGISTHHMGHYEFRLCNKLISPELSSRAEGQACLDAHVLERAPLDPSCTPNNGVADCQPIDPNNPGRWYVPPVGMATNPSDTDGLFPYGVGEAHRMRYKIPDDFSCEECTLQWYWATGNSCLYDAGYYDYFRVTFPNAGWIEAGKWCPWCPESWSTMAISGCGVGSNNYGEEFWNCADVAVTGGTGRSFTTTTATAAAPTSAAEPSTCSNLDLCNKLNNTFFGQGCQTWNGDATACAGSYITHDDVIVPCEWIACDSTCLAKGAAMTPCEEASLSCACQSTGYWSDAKCRNWCHTHPSFCSAECATYCTGSCICFEPGAV